jgi:asparagine synthase (glutamine-hydrolysing)
MCGIAGILDKRKRPDILKNKICQKMLDMIFYRGPDENKIINHKDFSCGVTRLSIESLKNGTQPVENNKYILGFNGEIFNYKELIKKYNFSKTINSEAKLLLELFNLKNENFTKEIKGQFAIFIYNKHTEEVLLFRDRYGIRPLFYYSGKNVFIFGSEIKTIVSTKVEDFKIDQQSFENTTMFWTNILNTTAIKNVFSLEPGNYLKFKNNKIIVKKYFENPIILKKKNYTKLITKKDFLEKFEKAIKSQIHGEVGHACYLSGGIDSAALAYFLKKNIKTQLDTFSIEFNDKSYDESSRQLSISKFLKTKHRSIKIKKKDIADNFEKVVNHAETFLFRTAPVPLFLLSKYVNTFKHKVVFTGEGADEVLFGYDIFFENKIRKFWAKNPKSKIRGNLFRRLYSYLPQFNNDRYFEITKDFYKKFLKDDDNIFYSHLVRWSQYDQVSKYFNFKRSKTQIMNNYKRNFSHMFKKIKSDRKVQFLEFDTLLSNYLLSSQGDRVSLANSIEGRYPFLDEEFTEFCSNVDSNFLAKGINSKSFFRSSLRGKIPLEIVNQAKIAYQAPEAKSFLDHSFISPAAEEFLDNLNKLEFINKRSFDGLVKKIRNKYSSDRLGFRENMSFILGISYYYLQKNLYKWQNY